jgi:RES domain-containing protein
LLDRLERINSQQFSDSVFRHVLGTNDPVRANTRGARWNPAGVSALYTSLDRETALAEGEFLLAAQGPYRPKVNRRLVELRVSLLNAVELDQDLLNQIGVSREVLQSSDFTLCQELGGGIHWLGHDGLIVPSARGPGRNLVIFTGHQDPDEELAILRDEVIR